MDYNLINLKKYAHDYFTKFGLPTSKQEQWQYTNLTSINITDFQILNKLPTVSTVIDNNLLLPIVTPYKFIFYNGYYFSINTDITTIKMPFDIFNLSQLYNTNLPDKLNYYYKLHNINNLTPLAALNLAYMQDGVYLNITDNANIEQPIYIVYLTIDNKDNNHDLMVHPKNHIFVGKNSKIKLIEHYININNINQILNNAQTIIKCDDNASVEHCILLQNTDNSIQLSELSVDLAAHSSFFSHLFTHGGKINRFASNINLNGIGSKAAINALECSKNHEQHDIYLDINHRAKNCNSKTIARGIMQDSSIGSFTGKITIHPTAANSTAYLQNKNLLLSKSATANTRPQLEIYNDQVQASHGATIGQIDQTALFYLNQRGIPHQQATFMLIDSFIQIVFESLNFDTNIKNNIKNILWGI